MLTLNQKSRPVLSGNDSNTGISIYRRRKPEPDMVTRGFHQSSLTVQYLDLYSQDKSRSSLESSKLKSLRGQSSPRPRRVSSLSAETCREIKSKLKQITRGMLQVGLTFSIPSPSRVKSTENFGSNLNKLQFTTPNMLKSVYSLIICRLPICSN